MTAPSDKRTIDLPGPEKTRELGRRLGLAARGGEVLALTGDLGAGKTTLTQGLALGLGLPPEREITSPTFVLLIIHTGGRLELYHADLYRLEAEEAEYIGLEEYLGHPDGVVVIEWADRAEEMLPRDRLSINLQWISPQERRAELQAHGPGAEKLLTALTDGL